MNLAKNGSICIKYIYIYIIWQKKIWRNYLSFFSQWFNMESPLCRASTICLLDQSISVDVSRSSRLIRQSWSVESKFMDFCLFRAASTAIPALLFIFICLLPEKCPLASGYCRSELPSSGSYLSSCSPEVYRPCPLLPIIHKLLPKVLLGSWQGLCPWPPYSRKRGMDLDCSDCLDLVDSTSVGDLGDDTFVLPDQGVVPTCKCTSLVYYVPFWAPWSGLTNK